MEFSRATLRPGVIIETYKTEGSTLPVGCIKALVPGLFAEEDKENLPPIYPACMFFGQHANNFSEPVLNDECTVMSVNDNPLELFWFRKDHYLDNNKDLASGENVEIICNRQKPDQTSWATIYFSDGDGWIIKNGEPMIQIDANGVINIKATGAVNIESQSTINIKAPSVKIEGNTDGAGQSLAYKESVSKALNTIAGAFDTLQKAATGNPYTANIAAGMIAVCAKLGMASGTFSGEGGTDVLSAE